MNDLKLLLCWLKGLFGSIVKTRQLNRASCHPGIHTLYLTTKSCIRTSHTERYTWDHGPVLHFVQVFLAAAFHTVCSQSSNEWNTIHGEKKYCKGESVNSLLSHWLIYRVKWMPRSNLWNNLRDVHWQCESKLWLQLKNIIIISFRKGFSLRSSLQDLYLPSSQWTFVWEYRFMYKYRCCCVFWIEAGRKRTLP